MEDLGDLTEAMIEGTASAALIKGWDNHSRKPKVADAFVARRRSLGFVFMASAGCVTVLTMLLLESCFPTFAGSYAGPLSWLFVAAYGWVIVCFACAFASALLSWHHLIAGWSDRLFLKDCMLLTGYIDSPGTYSFEQLEELAKEALVLSVFNALRTEGSPAENMTEAAEACRAAFKSQHALFLKFGLADQHWEPYFREGKRRYCELKPRADALSAYEKLASL